MLKTNKSTVVCKCLMVFIVLLCTLAADAQKVSIQAPSSVSTGENFRISYTVTNSSVDGFRMASIPSGLEVIAGPYTSNQSSYQIVNGHTSSSSSVTYTYTLYAEKAGNYTIPGARLVVGGKNVTSQPIHLKVSGAVRHNGSASPNMHDDNVAQVRSAGSQITGNDLFVKVTANKRRVYEQEPVLLTYKVYTLVDLTQLDGKMPDLKGFHTQEVKLPQQKSFHIEKVNGRNYRCVTWSQYVMYPQMTGKMSIPSITFKGTVVQQNRNVDPFEAFFNGGAGYVEVKRNIVAPGLDIEVAPLPNKPTGFSGGVGKFTISAQLNKHDIKAGEPLTLRVILGGVGNLKLVKQPVVDFPKDFDKYDPKVIDKTNLTANGIEGNMIYDYLVVPRNQGKYVIPSVKLTYFDTASETYKTIETSPIDVNVAKGDGSHSSVADYSEDVPTDIKNIREGKYTVFDKDNMYYGSVLYWLSLIIPFAAFVILLLIFRQRARENANIVGMKGKRANKIATKRLKLAYTLLNRGKQSEFYDEVLRALWGYASDKLNIPVEQLSRENIADKLKSKSISDDIISLFINSIDECEYERYAPGDATGNMQKTYDSAMNAIINIENQIKTMKSMKKNSGIGMSVLLMVCLFFFSLSDAVAVTKANADAEYLKGNYQQAAEDYKELLKSGESATLYYNLGNTYYRLGNITQSVIAYERALRLSPGDSDVRYNLQFVRSKTIDKIVPVEEMFFVVWYRAVKNSMSIGAWATISTVTFVMMLVLLLVFYLSTKVWLRKASFYSALSLLVVFCLSNVFAWQLKNEFDNRDGAIVVAPTSNVKKTPSDGGNDAFVIHEGTRVNIIDRTVKNWYSVRLDDGEEGWIKSDQVEII